MLELIKLRSQILSGNLPVDEMKDIKMKATSEIDTGNKLLGKVTSTFSIKCNLNLWVGDENYQFKILLLNGLNIKSSFVVTSLAQTHDKSALFLRLISRNWKSAQ